MATIKKLTKKQISKIANNEIGKSPYHKTFTAYKYSTKTGFDESIIKETCIEAYKIDGTRLIAVIAQNTSGSVYVKLIDTYWQHVLHYSYCKNYKETLDLIIQDLRAGIDPQQVMNLYYNGSGSPAKWETTQLPYFPHGVRF